MQKTILTCLFGLLFFTASTQINLSTEQREKINLLFEEWDSSKSPGVAIGVVSAGEPIYAQSFGMASLEQQISFTTNSVADIGSLAKQITAFGILLLSEEKKLSLNDNIRDYLPYVPNFGEAIKIRHLIHHTSGLREIYTALYIAGRQSGDLLRQDDVINFVKKQSALNFAPGEEFLYCNTAYVLLSEIIEKVSGKSYADFLKEKIFDPLGMANTYVMDRSGKIFPNCSNSYSSSKNTFFNEYDNCSMYGQGGIYSTVEDMMKWLGNFESPRVGSAATISRMQERGILNNGDTLEYAFGVYCDSYRRLKRVSHGGASAGYRSTLSWFPDQDLGFIIMSNCSDFNRKKAAKRITNILLADQFKDDDYGPRRRHSAQPINNKQAVAIQNDFQALEGTYYSDELETFYTISYENDLVRAEHFRLGRFILFPKAAAKDFFSSKVGEIIFERNHLDEVTGLKITMDRVRDLQFRRVRL